jgi:RecA/RadA recombinase
MDESSAKKARLELPNGHVKQEVIAPESAAGGEGGGAVVAAEYASRVELAVRIEMRVLHCPLCTRPFKPPVRQVLPFLSSDSFVQQRLQISRVSDSGSSVLCAVQQRAPGVRRLRRRAPGRPV